MNRVSDGDRSASLSFLSCGALQSDEIIGVLKVLFRYVGNGTRLALTSMDWLNTREAVILVLDPIAFAPGQALQLSSYKTHRLQLPIARSTLVSTSVTRRPSTISPSTSSSSSRRAKALCHLSRQDTSRGVLSQGRHVCVQKVAGASSDRSGYGAPMGRIGPSRSIGQCVCCWVTLS